jgi:hypothetical protein
MCCSGLGASAQHSGQNLLTCRGIYQLPLGKGGGKLGQTSTDFEVKHRKSACAASAAESEYTGRYQGCWKTLCIPDLSLPYGLNSERKGEVEHVGIKGNVGESHHFSELSMQSVYGQASTG